MLLYAMGEIAWYLSLISSFPTYQFFELHIDKELQQNLYIAPLPNRVFQKWIACVLSFICGFLFSCLPEDVYKANYPKGMLSLQEVTIYSINMDLNQYNE